MISQSGHFENHKIIIWAFGKKKMVIFFVIHRLTERETNHTKRMKQKRKYFKEHKIPLTFSVILEVTNYSTYDHYCRVITLD